MGDGGRWGRSDRGRDAASSEVELVEEAAAFVDLSPTEPAGALGPPGPVGPTRAGRGRRRVSYGLVVLGVLIAVVAGAAVAEHLADQQRRAALAGLEGVLASLDAPLEEQWRVPGGWVLAATEEALVLQHPGGGGVRALDPASGEQLWEHSSVGGDCRWRPGLGERLVCTDSTRGDSVGLATLDLASGSVQTLTELPGFLLGFSLHGEDVVLATTEPDGSYLVERWSLTEGERRWTHTSPDGELLGAAGQYFSMTVTSEHFMLEGERRVTLAMDTGEAVSLDAEPRGERETVWAMEPVTLADGAVVTWEWGWRLSEGAAGTTVAEGIGAVTDPDGTVRFELSDEPVVPRVDDGSADEVLLTVGTQDRVLRGLDPQDGTELWSSSSFLGEPMVVIDGLVLVATGDRVGAVDVRTGEERWSETGEGWGGLPTDGRSVLMLGREAGETWLVARRARDGRELWRERVDEVGPSAQLQVAARDRTVVIDDAWVVGYG